MVRAAKAVQGRAAVWVALRGASDGRARFTTICRKEMLERVRNLGDFRRDPGAGQVDVQRERAAGGVLEAFARAEVYGDFYRPGILF